MFVKYWDIMETKDFNYWANEINKEKRDKILNKYKIKEVLLKKYSDNHQIIEEGIVAVNDLLSNKLKVCGKNIIMRSYSHKIVFQIIN